MCLFPRKHEREFVFEAEGHRPLHVHVGNNRAFNGVEVFYKLQTYLALRRASRPRLDTWRASEDAHYDKRADAMRASWKKNGFRIRGLP